MERETGFEPATSTLARSHSTTELFPLAEPLKYHDRLDQGYGGVRLKPDPTDRRTELDAAPYRRWRVALSRCASVVGRDGRLPAEIFPYTDCATAFSSVSLHVSVGGPHFRVVRPLFGQIVASRLKYSRRRIVRPLSAPRSRAVFLSPVETRCRAGRRPTAGAR